MAETITINGTTISDATAALVGGVPVAGNYYPTGEPAEWGEPPCAGPPINDRRRIKFPAVPGPGEKDYQFEMRVIYVDVIVFATLANLRANVKSLLAGFQTNTRFTITINGTSYQGCKLDAKSCGRSKRINFGGGMVGEHLPLIFNQLSETN